MPVINSAMSYLVYAAVFFLFFSGRFWQRAKSALMFLTLRYALFRRIYARCKAFQIIFVEESVKDSKISQWRRVLRCRGFQILLCRRMLKISRYLWSKKSSLYNKS